MKLSHASVAAMLAVSSAAGLARAADPVSIPAPELKVGDAWVVERTIQKGQAGFSRARQELGIERLNADSMVVAIKAEGAPTAPQEHIIGRDWSLRLMVDGRQTATAQPLSFPLKVGESWTGDWTDPRHQGNQVSAHFHRSYKVVGWEDVTVPAGTFHALKIESNGVADADQIVPTVAQGTAITEPGAGAALSQVRKGGPREIHMTTYSVIYYAPEVKHAVKVVGEEYNASDIMTERTTEELVSFKPAA